MMRITSVSKYKGTTVCIEFDGRPNVYIAETIAEKYHLKEDVDIPEEALESVIHDDMARKAKERAFYLLATRDYCYSELYSKLERNYPSDICTAVCDKMQELGFIDDEEYAKKYARKLFECKGVGTFKAKMEMKRLGFTDEQIAAAIEPYVGSEETMQRLEELVEKKFERYLTDMKGVKKVKAALARLGYSFDEINAVLDLYDLSFSEN